MGPFQFCLPVFLGIHRNPKQKDFFNSSKGTSINDVTRFLAIFDLPTYLVLLYNVQFWGLSQTPLPTLISDVINGRSLWRREIMKDLFYSSDHIYFIIIKTKPFCKKESPQKTLAIQPTKLLPSSKFASWSYIDQIMGLQAFKPNHARSYRLTTNY